MRLKYKKTIITGAASGIGRAAALMFAREGASVCVVDRNRELALAVASQINEIGGNAFAKVADVASAADVANVVRVAKASWGRIDVLVNNAGYGIAGTVVDTSEADWNALMATNV